MSKNVKGIGNWKGKVVPGLKKAQNGGFIDPRIAEYQAKSDSIRSSLSPENLANYKGTQVYSNKYDEGQLDAPLSQDQIDEYSDYEFEGKIDPLNMTEEQMAMFNDDSYSMNPSKHGTHSPKISSYREMQGYDKDIKGWQGQSDKINTMMKSGMSEEDAKKMIGWKKRGGTSIRKKGGAVKGSGGWKGKNVPGMRYD